MIYIKAYNSKGKLIKTINEKQKNYLRKKYKNNRRKGHKLQRLRLHRQNKKI